MSRQLKIALLVLVVGVAGGALYLRGLHKRLLRQGQPQRTEEQARREVTQPPVTTPSDVEAKATIFFAAEGHAAGLEPVEVELPLSADPIQRAKQVILVLIVSPPKKERRTLPADAALLEFYLLPDGTAIADFSDALARATPSGILSEQMAVESITRTLAANVPNARRLRILINGQETETLAGHADLTGLFELSLPEGAARKPALTQSVLPGKL